MRGDRRVCAVHPAGGGPRPGEEGGGGGSGSNNHCHRGVLLPAGVQLPLQALDKAVGEAAEPGEDNTGDEDCCDYGENVGGDHHICTNFQYLEGRRKVGAGRPRRLPGAKRQLGGGQQACQGGN